MSNDVPCDGLCKAFGVKPEDLQYVPSARGLRSTDCPNCVFKSNGTLNCFEFGGGGRLCTASDRTDKQAGYWVLKGMSTKPLTLEQAEAKIAELQKYVETLKAKVPVTGELYKHKHNGDIYIVVQDGKNYNRLFLHFLKSENPHAGTGNQRWCKDSIFGDSRDDFTPIGHVQDLL